MNEAGSIGMIILAAGSSRRFGSNKLLEMLAGKKVYTYGLDNIEKANKLAAGDYTAGRCKELITPVIVVTGYEEIATAANARGYITVINKEPKKGISHSIKLGMKELRKWDTKAVVFGVCDQPLLSPATIVKLINTYKDERNSIIITAFEGNQGNPVLFDKRYYDELEALLGDVGGKSVVKNHIEEAVCIQAESGIELLDVDEASELEGLEAYLCRDMQ